MRRWYNFLVGFCFCVVVITSKRPPSCTTPNGERAKCVSIFSCPILKDAIARDDSSIKKFIEASSCGNGQFMICCGKSGNYTGNSGEPNLGNKNSTKESRREYVIKNLLPRKQYCGLQHTDDYFYNETATSVDEFPWIGYIPLIAWDPTGQGLETKCVGVLINNLYALTRADCASRFLEKIILGQYHKNKNVSCIHTSFGEEDCAESIEVKVHMKMGLPDSGIMLLRFKEKISYTDYIRPICLPLEESDRLQVGEKVFSSGWGEQNEQGKFVKIKKRIEHTVVSNDQCPKSDTTKICAATHENSSSYVCGGDDGTPLMYKRGNNWFAAGIISIYSGCYNNEAFQVEPITSKVLEFLFEHMKP